MSARDPIVAALVSALSLGGASGCIPDEVVLGGVGDGGPVDAGPGGDGGAPDGGAPADPLVLDVGRLDWFHEIGTTPCPTPTMPPTATLRNVGGAPIDWTATGVPAYLAVSPPGGNLPPDGAEAVRVTFVCSDFPPPPIDTDDRIVLEDVTGMAPAVTLRVTGTLVAP